MSNATCQAVHMLSGTDNVALFLAGVSAGISVLSLVVSYRAYRRAGTRVHLSISFKRYEDDRRSGEISLRATNKGMGSIQIVSWMVEIKEGWMTTRGFPYIQLPGSWIELPIYPANHRPVVPRTLNGYHAETWIIKDYISKFPDFGPQRLNIYNLRWRWTVTLGTGKILKKRWWAFWSLEPGAVTRRTPEKPS